MPGSLRRLKNPGQFDLVLLHTSDISFRKRTCFFLCRRVNSGLPALSSTSQDTHMHLHTYAVFRKVMILKNASQQCVKKDDKNMKVKSPLKEKMPRHERIATRFGVTANFFLSYKGFLLHYE